MTLKELAQQFGYKEDSLRRNFKRTQENLAKKGIILTKWGHGKNAEYEIEYEEIEEEE